MSAYDPQISLLSSLLKQNSGRTIAQALEGLLEKRINIPPGLRSKASDSHSHLRDFLRTESSRDYAFPQILAESDFLGGSFARHTKIWPLDDIDIYFPLDGANLIYSDGGVRLPYTVLANGPTLWNPLLSDRWAVGSYVSSAKLVQGFANVLKRHSPKTTIRPTGQSVSVQMSHGETKEAEGLGYDIVPCFALKPDDPNEFEFFVIPDGLNGWIRTNPKLDTDVADIVQSFHNQLYRKVVKLTKYWNASRFGARFSSYYIEFALSRRFWKRKQENHPVGSLAEGLSLGFAALEEAHTHGNLTSWISGAPPIARPSLSAGESAQLDLARIRAEVAWLLEQNGKERDALLRWGELFGEAL